MMTFKTTNSNNNNNNNNNLELTWGAGGTDLFLAPCEDGGFEVLDYEFDFDRIHEKCGGKHYYTSMSGCSGAGYIRHYADLIRVGYYRVDTRYNVFHFPQQVAEGISLMLPYVPHQRDKEETLAHYPVVICKGKRTIIYCGFYTTMNEALTRLLSGQELWKDPRLLNRHFYSPNWGEEEDVELEFYNFFGWNTQNPWEFATELLKDFRINYPDERLYQIFHLGICPDGTLVKTSEIGEWLYATEVLKGDPCEHLSESDNLPGWEVEAPNLVYKVRKDTVYIVGWQLAEESYRKEVERLDCSLPASEEAEFKNSVLGNIQPDRYVEFELNVPKLLFFLDKEKQFDNVRKGIADKVGHEVEITSHLVMVALNKVKLEIPA